VDTAFSEDGSARLMPKRILLLSHEMTYTGAPCSLLNMACLLRKRGHSVSVYTLEAGNFTRCFHRHGFSVRYAGGNYFTPDVCRSLAEEYDLAVCNTVFCGKAACCLQDYMKTILMIREAENLPGILKDCGIDEDCIRNVENMVCVSEYAERFLRKTYAPGKLWVLHNFLMCHPFYRPRPNIVRKGKVRFLVAATVEKRKGIDIAVKAVKSLDKDISGKMVLDLAGRKPEWSREYWDGLIPVDDDRVLYHGEVTDGKRKLFERANVIMVPSLDEACSLTALEGAMYGKPLIVTENVGAKYLTEGSGFVVKTGSVEGLAEAMEFFVQNQKTLEAAGKISFGNFCRTSCQDVYYRKLSGILSEVLNE